MAKRQIVAQYIQFLREERKYWLLPIIGFILIAMLMAFAQSTVLAPFIYTLF
jgi:hypothetical protein